MSQYHFIFRYQHKIPEGGTEKRELILLSFSGRETISELFDFELELKSDDIQLDEDGVINQTCSIEIYYANSTTPIRVIHGLINEFEDVSYFPDCTLYRARVVPRVWQLSYFETNEVYLNETIEQTLTVMLEEAGFLLGQDFRFELNRSPTYRAWPFRLQYNETHLDYLQRIIEREGIYYYFEHSDNADVMVFCDNNQSLPKIVHTNEADKVTFQANSGVLIASGANTVNSIICKRHTLPKKVTLRDFNDETPSLDIRGEFVINKTGIGDINLYGLNITSPEEGQQLAEIHANAYLCRQKSYIGQGDVATMLAGHTFNLQHHPRAAFNELGYLLESIEHEGANLNQYQAIHPDDHSLVNYANNFTALSSAHQFAPKRQTLAPEINGTLNAIVDTEVDSGYAELDQFGRYKVKLPFDRKDRGEDGGKASHWVRMMQPYGGSGEGMHFPLRKGTRVLLGFIGGDPDRPFISGTINDSGDQQSIVTGENQTNNLIQTASGNKIELEDKEGKNRIKLQTGDDSTYMHLGAPNHDGSGYVMVTDGIERRDIGGGQRVTVTTGSGGSSMSSKVFDSASNYDVGDIVTYDGKVYKCITPVTASVFDVSKWDIYIRDTSLFSFKSDPLGPLITTTSLTKEQEVNGDYIIARTQGEQRTWNSGNQYNYFATGADATPSTNNKHFFFGNNWQVHCSDHNYSENSEPLIQTMEDYALKGVIDFFGVPLTNTTQQAITTLAAYKVAVVRVAEAKDALKIATAAVIPFDVVTQNAFIAASAVVLAAAAELVVADDAAKSADKAAKIDVDAPVEWKKYLSKGRVNVARHDTFTAQNGNIFDFGGYWNYNLGNSYAENLIKQAGAEVNRSDLPYDWCDIGGPNWAKLEPKKKVTATTLEMLFDKVSKPDYFKTEDKLPVCSFYNNTQTEKNIKSHSYNYSDESHSIDVSHKCNSVEVSVAGTSHEVKYNGSDVKVYQSMSGGGISEEWKSTPSGDRTEYEKVDISGPGKVTETRVEAYKNPVSYEIVREPAPGSKFSFKGDAFPTLDMSMNVDVGDTKLSTHIGAMSNSVGLDIHVMKNSIDIDMTGLKNAIEISGAVINNKCELELVTGMGSQSKFKNFTRIVDIDLDALKTDLEKRIAEINLNLSDFKMETNEGIQANKANITLNKTQIDIDSASIKLLSQDIMCLIF